MRTQNQVIETVNSGHSGRVTSIHAGLGSLVIFQQLTLLCKILISKVTASSDGDIRVLQPTRKPTLINLLKV